MYGTVQQNTVYAQYLALCPILSCLPSPAITNSLLDFISSIRSAWYFFQCKYIDGINFSYVMYKKLYIEDINYYLRSFYSKRLLTNSFYYFRKKKQSFIIDNTIKNLPVDI